MISFDDLRSDEGTSSGLSLPMLTQLVKTQMHINIAMKIRFRKYISFPLIRMLFTNSFD